MGIPWGAYAIRPYVCLPSRGTRRWWPRAPTPGLHESWAVMSGGCSGSAGILPIWERRHLAGPRLPAGSRRSQGSVPVVTNPGWSVLVVVTILLLVLSSATPALPRATVDWPLFGGTSDNTRFAALAQINTTTVKRLRVAWRRDEGFGQFTWETFPVVVGRRMYLTTNTNQVWALDAATGSVIWTYTPRVTFFLSGVGAKNGVGAEGLTPPTNRGVAVAAGKVYELTFDCHLLALDAATGKLLWQVAVADPRRGYYETTPPPGLQ